MKKKESKAIEGVKMMEIMPIAVKFMLHSLTHFIAPS
jgi:hypothetical protein